MPVSEPTRLERFLNRFYSVHTGEGRSVALFFSYALLMMVGYYILKTIREPLLLAGSGAEYKSYAHAVIALLLLFIVPLYGAVFRNTRKLQLTRIITLFFMAFLVLFYLLGRAGVDIGFAYYVWVGIFAVMVPTQFWAFAADCYSVESGKRLFPVIMVGATAGSLLAPSLSGALFPTLGPWLLMLAAMGLLALTLPLVKWSKSAIPVASRSLGEIAGAREHGGLLGGLSLVFSNRFLFLLALMILLLNWVNTTGEYILADLVVCHAVSLVTGAGDSARSVFFAGFYGSFFSTVNLLTLLFQLFAVARIFQWIGVRGAVLVLPLISLVGYGLVAFIPVFSLIRVVKLMENSTDYSLMNTTRHALYLPLPRAHKYEGKTAIDGFFWRFGDLAQAGIIFAGLHWFDFDIQQFAAVNMVLSVAWLAVAWRVSRNFGAVVHRQQSAAEAQSR